MSVLKIFSKHARLLKSIYCVILIFLPAHAWSEQQLNDVSSPLDFNQIFSVMFGLGFVLLLFFVLVYVLKKLPAINGARSGIIKIIDTLYLSSNEKIILVKIGEQQLLLGVTGQKIEKLAEINEEFSPVEQEAESYMKSFSEVIAEKMLSKSKKS